MYDSIMGKLLRNEFNLFENTAEIAFTLYY